MTYPIKFREHVLKIQAQEKLSFSQTAQRFQIGTDTLVRWHKRLVPATRIGTPRTIDPQVLLEDVRLYPDAYLRERAQRLDVSKSGIEKALKRLGITRKKRLTNTPKPIQRHKNTSKPK